MAMKEKVGPLGHLALAEHLARRGAEASSTTKDDWQPLHLAAQMGFEPVIEFLLGLANKRIANKEDKMPMDVAREASIRKLLE